MKQILFDLTWNRLLYRGSCMCLVPMRLTWHTSMRPVNLSATRTGQVSDFVTFITGFTLVRTVFLEMSRVATAITFVIVVWTRWSTARFIVDTTDTVFHNWARACLTGELFRRQSILPELIWSGYFQKFIKRQFFLRVPFPFHFNLGPFIQNLVSNLVTDISTKFTWFNCLFKTDYKVLNRFIPQW